MYLMKAGVFNLLIHLKFLQQCLTLSRLSNTCWMT